MKDRYVFSVCVLCVSDIGGGEFNGLSLSIRDRTKRGKWRGNGGEIYCKARCKVRGELCGWERIKA